MEDLVLYFSLKYNGNFELIYNAVKNKEEVDHEIAVQLKKQLKCKYVTIFSHNYPESLKHINCPPFVLYYEGDLSLLDKKKVSIVVANDNTRTKQVVEDFMTDMSEYKDYVLIQANNRIMKSHNKTITIMNRGIGFYEREKEFYSSDLVLSEYPFNTVPCKKLSLFYNRIMIGLSDSVIIADCVESDDDVMSVGYAIEQNKRICALGNIAELYKLIFELDFEQVETFQDFMDDK